MTLRVAAVLLAAGAGRRMAAAKARGSGRGAPKPLHPWKGEPLVRRAAKAAQSSRCADVLVVVGARGDEVRRALDDLEVTIVECGAWEEGMAASIRAGVAAAAATTPPVDAVLVALADQPEVDTAHVDALIGALETGRSIVASAYAGTVGAPAVFARRWFPELLGLEGDRGAKALLEAGGDEVARVRFEPASVDVDEPT